MLLSESGVALENGEAAVHRVVEPPAEEHEQGVVFGWGIRERLLGGDFLPWSRDRFFLMDVEGSPAGSVTLSVPRDRPEVGIVGFVNTAEPHRRKGIAKHLLSRLIKAFINEGGLALYLCTVNPVAYRLYHGLGFRSLVGDGMRYLSPTAGDFDYTYFAHCGRATSREAHWGDLARFAALYNWPRHDDFLKDYPQRVFGEYRFEKHFVAMMQAHEQQKGHLCVLQTAEGRVVGVCSLTQGVSYYEQHVATLDFVVVESYLNQASELITHACEVAVERGWHLLVHHQARSDRWKADVVEAAGFSPETRLSGYFKDGETEVDLVTWCRRLPVQPVSRRTRGAYYGGRPDFLDDA